MWRGERRDYRCWLGRQLLLFRETCYVALVLRWREAIGEAQMARGNGGSWTSGHSSRGRLEVRQATSVLRPFIRYLVDG